MAFEGFPAESFEFYERLEADNSRTFWSAHKGDYERYVREPMLALADDLEGEFGSAHLFRPNRDIRFSADKSPYKTYQGMFVSRVPGTGFYVQLSADGVHAGGGFHSHGPDQVERYRKAVDAERTGSALATIVAGLERDGLAVGGEQLKTRPRGIPTEHPRVDLLRYRSLTAGRDWPAGPKLSGSAALDLIRQTWTQLIPLCDWLGENVGASQA
ncbi:MAG: DUF2461 domain-containing protein [Streptosporangiaceae bacterium]